MPGGVFVEVKADAIKVWPLRPPIGTSIFTSVLPDDVQMRLYKADGGAEDAGAKGASMTARGADEISIDSSEMVSHSE